MFVLNMFMLTYRSARSLLRLQHTRFVEHASTLLLRKNRATVANLSRSFNSRLIVNNRINKNMKKKQTTANRMMNMISRSTNKTSKMLKNVNIFVNMPHR